MILDDFTQGETVEIGFDFGVDISGSQITLQLRKRAGQEGNDFEYVNTEHVSASEGLSGIVLSSEQTTGIEPGTYVYQIWYSSATDVFLIEQGNVEVSKSFR